MIEAFTKYEFQRRERPAFRKDCTAEMKSLDEKWRKACNTWATKAEGERGAPVGSDEGVAGGGDGEEAKRIRTLYCVKCSNVKAQQKSRTHSAKWNESVGTVRCSSNACLTLFSEQTESTMQRGKGSVRNAQSGERTRYDGGVRRQRIANGKPRRRQSC